VRDVLKPSLVVLGAGYSALQCAKRTRDFYSRILGTTRTADRLDTLASAGIHPRLFDGTPNPRIEKAIATANHLLVSIAPNEKGDPVLNSLKPALVAAPELKWVCYLSTVGVYGDHNGAWVDETSECRPGQPRSIQRLAAERAWQESAQQKGIPLAILRLSGIYGPGRNAFVNIKNGTARRLIKPGQVFNRIHRDDIAAAFVAAANKEADGIFNITDDEPAPPQDVVAYACELAGVEPPPETDFATAELSPMARSFYGENKRVSNAKSKRDLGMTYAYPDFRTALKKMWQEERWG
jgi:nucleoside-diphosphate-sugar epimerase